MPAKNRLVKFAVLRFVGGNEFGSVIGAIDGLGEEEVGTGFDLAVQILHFGFHILRAKIERGANEKVCRLTNARAGMIDAHVEALLDKLDQTGRNEVIVVSRFGIIADGSWVAHDDEDVANAEGMCSEQIPCTRKRLRPRVGKCRVVSTPI